MQIKGLPLFFLLLATTPCLAAPMMSHDTHETGMQSTPETNAQVISRHKMITDAIAWSLPAGWEEFPASGMRLASFKQAKDTEAIDVSIVLLGSNAGSVEANLDRWAEQIRVQADPQEMLKFIHEAPAVKTKLKTDAMLFDFTKLQAKEDSNTKSMLAAIIRLNDITVFIKMLGTIQTVQKNRAPFKALVESIRPAD